MLSDAEQAWFAQQWLGGWTQNSIGKKTGYRTAVVCIEIKKFCEKWAKINVQELQIYDKGRKNIAEIALKKFVRKRGAVRTPVAPVPKYHPPTADIQAYSEHAWLLRAENKTYYEIGVRLGVSTARAIRLVKKFGRRVERASKRSSWEWSVG